MSPLNTLFQRLRTASPAAAPTRRGRQPDFADMGTAFGMEAWMESQAQPAPLPGPGTALQPEAGALRRAGWWTPRLR